MDEPVQVTSTQPVATPEKSKLLMKIPAGGGRKNSLLILGSLVVVLVGIGTGWLLSGKSKGASSSGELASGTEQSATEEGIADEATFRDSAEGFLEEGGINGEGTHHLVREGGPTKYVYMTSTVIDLQRYKDKNVQVWGETISAQQAGWLMDVGKIKVVE